MVKEFDFSGWATKANIKCSDGRTIMKDAFKHNDGDTVPLVWNHKHDDVNEVLGHALLENREEGVYAYCKFNDTDNGKTAKLLVQHGDVDQLSIYANQLKQQGPFVMHGNIRELSLVLAGANPGAFIENVVMMHGENMHELEDEAHIFTGEYISLSHADKEEDEKGEEKVSQEKENAKSTAEEVKDEEKKETKDESEETIEDVINTFTEKQKTVLYALIGQAIENKNAEDVKHSDDEIEHSEEDDDEEDEDETIADVFDTLTEKQQKVVYAMIGQAIEDATNNEESEGGNETMKHNVFENEERIEETVLSHSEMMDIMNEAKQGNASLKATFLAHGIENIGELFPEANNVTKTPELYKREDSWVTDVLNAVHHTPFSRIKSTYADITGEQARARGYVKGNLKVEEVIKAFKRVTTPATVYKKQKLDRDDVIDITDFDVVAWLRAEMRAMLNEELARAILVGDGREDDNDDKINEENIRPIWKDSDVYTVKHAIPVAAAATSDEKAKAFIRASIKSRKNYKGSGAPVMFMSDDMLTDCLLIEDGMGRLIYDSMDKLANALGVKRIVSVPVMENLTREDSEGKTRTLAGLYVNLADYNVGADKGGAVNMFDDFDIDYNAQKYLIETRCSGALTKPYAAVALEFVPNAAG